MVRYAEQPVATMSLTRALARRLAPHNTPPKQNQNPLPPKPKEGRTGASRHTLHYSEATIRLDAKRISHWARVANRINEALLNASIVNGSRLRRLLQYMPMLPAQQKNALAHIKGTLRTIGRR